MVKVVLDTNIWLSTILFRGRLAPILDYWKDKAYQVYFSPKTFEEFQEKFLWWGKKLHKEEEMLTYLLFVKKNAKFVYPEKHFTLCEDATDNMFLDVAFEGKVDYLVSGDKKLLVVKAIEGIPIIAPSKFLQYLQI